MSANESPASKQVVGTRNLTLSIFLISVVGLFLEMMLIRWIGTEIRIFAYLQNTVLIVCFLGLGMGCFTCRKRASLRHSLVALLLLTLILAVPATRSLVAHISTLLGALHDFVIWNQGGGDNPIVMTLSVIAGVCMTFGLMVLLWEIFMPLGRLLGRMMDDHPRTIRAYSANVAGSLVGIALFAGASVLYLPPVGWFLVVGVLLIVMLGRSRQRIVDFGLVALIVGAAWFASREPTAIQTTWSPYQKLVLSEVQGEEANWLGQYLVSVNNVGYQGMFDLSTEGVRENECMDSDRYGLSQYDIPFLLHESPDRVLTVGAGTGNDPAGALRGGAQSVTAVEIDPAIIQMGRRYHPERPYDSPKITVVNDDARSYFANSNEKFDVVVFGLLDSHTTTAMTNARLDHYVYTRESIERAKQLLAPGGIMALSFEAQKPYIADRMARCLAEVFGESPIVFRIPHDAHGWGGVMFLTGDFKVLRERLAAQPKLASYVRQWQAERPVELAGTAEIASDDWPYIYLEHRRIPVLFYLLGLLMVGMVLYCKRRLKLPHVFGNWQRSHWHFFFLGAAFLLLEVQNISKASVALGNTWVVNAVIISGILCMILLANLIAARFPRLPYGLAAFCLIASCLGLYTIDLASFALLPYATKALLVGGLTTLPMLFSGILFIQAFAVTPRKDAALGANLIGSLVGGLLQSVTFVVGIKALLLIVAGLYLAAVLTRPRLIADTEATLEKGTVQPEEEPTDNAQDDRTDGVEQLETAGV